MSKPATRASFRSVIPRTPVVSRPIGRTCFSLNRMALPSVVAMISSSDPALSFTQLSSSPSVRLMAIRPARLYSQVRHGEPLGLPVDVGDLVHPQPEDGS